MNREEYPPLDTDAWIDEMVRRHFADGHQHMPWGASTTLCPYALMEHPFLALPPFDARGQQVTCRVCQRRYKCLPWDDYHEFTCADDGLCWRCLLAGQGLDAERLPVTVVDATGRELDPREGLG